MSYWLVKSEESSYSIEDFSRDKTTQWTGVRNYQARNNLKSMKVDDEVLFYHSVEDPRGICGLAKVAKVAYPDPFQFDKRSDYFDEKATKENPRWFAPDLKFVKKFKKFITLDELREVDGLSGMVLLTKGSRLSVQPVTESEFRIILKLDDGK